MHLNAVSILRHRESQKLHRPFSARGSKLTRCSECLLVEHHCICGLRPRVETDCAFCFIFYQGEVFKPSNTGRLIADVVADNYAFQWQRTQVEARLKDLLSRPDYLPILVFPHEYAEPGRCIDSVSDLKGLSDGRKPLFIVLDGTWREAKKMFRSEYLKSIPVLGLNPDKASNYQLRAASHQHQFCTAEVGIEILNLIGEKSASEALSSYFESFKTRYLASKSNVVLKGNVEQ
jgi:DTW domain-containing protein YfiP